MSYSKEKISEIVVNSISLLKEKQPMLFLKEDDIAERAVSAALHTFFIPHFPDYDVNCEYNRMTDENGIQISKRIHRNPYNENTSRVFPDIIVHQQKNGDNNLLVVEIKMEWKNAEKDDDYKKLIGYTTDLRYEYGLYIELGEKGITEMTWFQNGKQI
jgi:hypothetical protein